MGLFDFLKNKFSKKDKTQETTDNTSDKVVSDASTDKTASAEEEKTKAAERAQRKAELQKAEDLKKKQEEERQQANKDAYVRGLSKARHGFMNRLKSLTSMFHKVNDEYFDELEEILIEADVGADLTFTIIDEAKKQAKLDKIDTPEEINKLVVEKMFEGYQAVGTSSEPDLAFAPEGPTVLLVVGVNGVGKTTTIAKLAKRYKDMGKKVLLVAADTFRAGASEQLQTWANKVGVDIVLGPEGSDPSSLCYEGLSKAKAEHFDLVIVDTAGRLQNKANLMAELGKMRRVMAKVIPSAPQETFLIIDANTGQNGVEQAEVFKDVTPLTGLVITKMDGTSKGGIILPIREKLGIPVRFIGLGEGMADLKEFDLDDYLYGLLIGDDGD